MTGKARAEGMLDAFEWLGYAALLLGRDGAIIGYNNGARERLGSTIQVVNGQLAARDRAAIQQSQGEKYPQEYGPLVEQYLKNLSDQGSGK